MPLYDYQCFDCDSVETVLVQRSADAPSFGVCSVCGGASKKLFPLTCFNLYDENYEPPVVSKRTLNPEKLMSNKPGAGADYAIRYHQKMSGESWKHVGGVVPEDRPIPGTVRDIEARKAGKRGH